MTSIDMVETGNNIKRLLETKGWTRRHLAGLCAVTVQTVEYWVNGKRFPAIEHLIDLSEIFDTSIDAIVARRKYD